MAQDSKKILKIVKILMILKVIEFEIRPLIRRPAEGALKMIASKVWQYNNAVI